MAEPNVLVCAKEPELLAALRAAGFAADGELDAIASLERDIHDIVLLTPSTAIETRDYLRGLVGARRRDIYVVDIAPGHITGSRERAWWQSADLLVAAADASDLPELLRLGFEDKRGFYARFRALAASHGDN